MLIRKEHVIATCVPSKEDEESRFWQSVVESSFPRSKHTLVTKIPLPERELVYLVKFWPINELSSTDTRHVFGFGATESVFLDERNLRVDFLNSFEGFIFRLVRDNPNIRYYGIRILFFFSPESSSRLPQKKDEADEILFELDHLMRGWCLRFRSSLNVEVTFDFITDETYVSAILEDDLRRIRYGERVAQYGGANW